MKHYSAVLMLSGSVLACSMATSAFAASTFTYSGYDVLNNTNVNISAGPVNGAFGSGQISLYGADGTANQGQTLQAWCLDAFDDLQGTYGKGNGGVYTMTAINSPFNNAGLNGTPISSSALGEIGALVHESTSPSFLASAVMSPAVQIAIWDLEYQGTGYVFSSQDGSVNTEVSALLTGAADLTPYTNLNEVVGPNNQALVFDAASGAPVSAAGSVSAVPLPTALPLFLSGLAVILGLHIRRRKAMVKGI